jgi:hypothetical protein
VCWRQNLISSKSYYSRWSSAIQCIHVSNCDSYSCNIHVHVHVCTYPYFLVVSGPYPGSIVIGGSQNQLSLERRNVVSFRERGGGRERSGWGGGGEINLHGCQIGLTWCWQYCHRGCTWTPFSLQESQQIYHSFRNIINESSRSIYLVHFSSSILWWFCLPHQRLGSGRPHWTPRHTLRYHEHPRKKQVENILNTMPFSFAYYMYSINGKHRDFPHH